MSEAATNVGHVAVEAEQVCVWAGKSALEAPSKGQGLGGAITPLQEGQHKYSSNKRNPHQEIPFRLLSGQEIQKLHGLQVR